MKIVMHSGGAVGSDKLWGDVLLNGTMTPHEKEVNHYYYKQKTPYGNKEITTKDFNEGVYFAKLAAKKLNKNWSNKSFVQYLLARNWVQVREAQIILAIGYLDNETQQVHGGTGYAVEMAKYLKKPIYLINLKNLKGYTLQDINNLHTGTLSYDYTKNKFKKDLTVVNKLNIYTESEILYSNFAGIGTRDLNGIDEELLIYKMQELLHYLFPDITVKLKTTKTANGVIYELYKKISELA